MQTAALREDVQVLANAIRSKHPAVSSRNSMSAYRHALELAPDIVKPRIRAIVAKLGG